MANNYRQFSALLKLETPEQLAWCKEEIARRRLTRPDGTTVEDEEDLESHESLGNFTAQPIDEGLWFAPDADDYDNTNHIAQFVQAFLQRYNPRGCWWVSWADTCSSPRIDEFSGGAVFVTATEVKYVEAQDWARQMTEAHDRGTPCP